MRIAAPMLMYMHPSLGLVERDVPKEDPGDAFRAPGSVRASQPIGGRTGSGPEVASSVSTSVARR